MFVNIPATKPLALLHLLSSTLFLLKSDVLIMEVIPKYKRYAEQIDFRKSKYDSLDAIKNKMPVTAKKEWNKIPTPIPP